MNNNITINNRIILNQPIYDTTFELKKIPLELFEKIFSYLNCVETSSMALVSHFWNGKTLHVLKNREFAKIATFSRMLAGFLDNNIYSAQKTELTKIICDKDFNVPLSFKKTNEKISLSQEQIKIVLSAIWDNDLDILFDSFREIKNKPRLFYKYVFKSNKYKDLYEQLQNAIKQNLDIVILSELLQKGAIPTRTSLDMLLHKRYFSSDKFDERILKLLKTDAIIPTSSNLSEAIQIKSVPITKALLDAGVIPKKKHLRFAITNENYEIVRLILNKKMIPNSILLNIFTDTINLTGCSFQNKESFGAILDAFLETHAFTPTSDHLIRAIELDLFFLFDMMLDKGAVPTEQHLNYAVEHSQKEIIRVLLKKKISPTQNTLNIAISKASLETVQILLKTGVSPDESHLNFAVKKECSEIIKGLLKAGAIPTKNTLDLAEQTKILNQKDPTLSNIYGAEWEATCQTLQAAYNQNQENVMTPVLNFFGW